VNQLVISTDKTIHETPRVLRENSLLELNMINVPKCAKEIIKVIRRNNEYIPSPGNAL
jgi:hypothetical protein